MSPVRRCLWIFEENLRTHPVVLKLSLLPGAILQTG